MPDQYILLAYQALLLPDQRPDFVQCALISPHAPWTPIADVVPWEDVGDGCIFHAMAVRAPDPKTLWRDRDAERDAHRRSVDHALRVTFGHVARLREATPLIIVTGDQQPASFVAAATTETSLCT